MRLLHVIPGLASRTGGPGVAVVESSLALEQLGVETTILATDVAAAASAGARRAVTPEELPRGAESLDVRLFPLRRPHRLIYSPALDRALDRTIASYDVAHIHSLFLFPQLAAYRHARANGVPYVVSPRGALDPWLRARGRARKALVDLLWQRRMLEHAAALHVTSEEEARLIADVAPATPRAVIPNGIRWDEFASLPPREEFRDRFLHGHRGPLVLNLGRVARKKGLDVLIRAFALVAGELPEARLAIVGPDDEGLTPELRAVAAGEGVAGQVDFVPHVSGRDKLAALAAPDAWALSSHTENFGIAVAEALAAGLAVVVSPAVNIAADVADEGAGVVVEQTPRAFADALLRLLRDDADRHRLGARARAFARRYDWAAVAPQLLELYERAAHGATRPRELVATA